MTLKLNKLEKDRKIYGNCQVQSPNGILMFRCDDKKANWYLNRELASIISYDPFIIKLKFEPRGLGNSDKPYGISEMKNICVNCGTDEFLTRHHVIPICYRKHFPINLKSHNFHDVLSMCVNCHVSYERKADNLKLKLSEIYNSPINGYQLSKSNIEKREYLKVCKYANILLSNFENIPENRIEKIKEKISDYIGGEFTELDIKNLSESKKEVVLETHGKLVMNQISDIQSFIEMWREHFLENNSCKYLPKNWNVKNKIIINE